MFALAGCKVPTIKSKSRVLQCVCVCVRAPLTAALTRRMRAPMRVPMCRPQCAIVEVRQYQCQHQYQYQISMLVYFTCLRVASVPVELMQILKASIISKDQRGCVCECVCLSARVFVYGCQANQFPNCWPKNRYNYRRRCITHHNTHEHEYAPH